MAGARSGPRAQVPLLTVPCVTVPLLLGGLLVLLAVAGTAVLVVGAADGTTAPAVAAGAAAGAALRWAAVERAPTDPPATVAAVNAVGSALLGLLLGAGALDHPAAAAALGVGLCGALTTFSTAAVDVVRAPGRRPAAALAAAHVLGSLVAAAAGLRVGALLGG